MANEFEVDRMTALAADALIGMRSGRDLEAVKPLKDNPREDAFSVPFFTDEEERREKQEMSQHEKLDVESDVRGITTGMDTMSIARGNVGSPDCGPVGQGTSGPPEPCVTGRNCKYQHHQQHRSPEDIQRDLKLLNKELERIPAADKAAYLTAVQRCPDEVLGGGWRWEAFLEEQKFDAKRTAKNIIEYWKRRLALFGEDRCYLPMTLTGAMQDEVTGMMAYDPHRISPVKDAAGRTVVVITPSRRDRSLYSTKSQSKTFLYLLEVIAQDPEARRCGVVVILNQVNAHPGQFDPRFVQFAVSTLDLFPMSWKSEHIVNANMLASHIIIPSLKFVLGRRNRNRLIVHTGTVSNTVDDMQNYALPPDRLPKDIGGEVVVDIRAWMNERYAKEVLKLAESGMNLNEDVEPSVKRIRRELLPDVSDASCKDNTATVVPSSDELSHTPQRRDRCEPSPIISMSHIQQQPAGLPEPLPPTPRRPVVEIKMTEEEYVLLGHKNGRKADPRMTNAIILKLRNPDMDNFDILIAAGFNYPPQAANKKKEKETLDDEGVSLRQRKNQLNRRLKQLKPKQEKLAAQKRSGQRQQESSQEGSSREDSSAKYLSHDMSNLSAPASYSPARAAPPRDSSYGHHALAVLPQDEPTNDPVWGSIHN